MGAAASRNSILPVTASVMAVGSTGFLFHHVSAVRRDKEAYRKEKLSIRRDQLEMIKETKNSISTAITDFKNFVRDESNSMGKTKK